MTKPMTSCYCLLGQWASTRSDMFDEELCSSLATLHSNAPAHSWECTQATVEEALGLSPGTIFEVFDSFDAKPLASGSIAQIHKAVLKPPTTQQGQQVRCQPSSTGTTIAVKVRHPMVAELIDWDFRIILRIADVIDSVSALKWLNVRSSVEQFSHTMAAQAHLDIEAHHLEVLNYNFRRWKAVGFPRPYYATNSIICETFEYGEVVTTIIDKYDNEADRLGRPGYELIPGDLAKFIVTNGLSVYMKMLLVDNLMHADLHPVCRLNLLIGCSNCGIFSVLYFVAFLYLTYELGQYYALHESPSFAIKTIRKGNGIERIQPFSQVTYRNKKHTH